MALRVAALILPAALAHASGLEAVCAAGKECASRGEQEETGMLQTRARKVETTTTTPTSTEECENVSGINTGLPIVYDPTCPGVCCFETYPCRYCTEGCGGACDDLPDAAPAPAPEEGTTPTNTEECKSVSGINPAVPIVYDDTCPGACCFETYPCRYCSEGCGGACDDLPAALAQEMKFMPNTTDECYNVSGINTAVPIVYDDTCPGACCFESYPCRYCSGGCGGGACDDLPAALAQEVKFMPNTTDECKNVSGINTAVPIVYDPTCPGACCFETYPCRYCSEGCGGACDDLPAALAQEVKFMPNTTDECYNVSGINTAVPIVYDDTCPGACCFESYPCRYCSEGCGGACLE